MASITTSSTKSARLALFSLGLGAFGIGTTEFAPMGLLPAIAEEIDVSIPAAGQLVTAYAVGVMISAPFMTLYLARFGQKRALLICMALFIIGNLVTAIAPDYTVMLIGRLITSLCQGAFFGFGAVAATGLVPPERRASAVAVMFMGLSIATIGGVPLATWLGETIGWRIAFLSTVGLGLLAFAAMGWALPASERGRTTSMLKELLPLFSSRLSTSLFTTILFAGGFFALYTYVSPLFQSIAGADPKQVTVLLVLIGLGLTLGNWLGGKLADWSLEKGAALGLAGLFAMSLLIPVVGTTPFGLYVGFFLWATSAFSCVPALQLRAMQAVTGSPSLAASLNIAAFNLGNAVGAIAGGAVIEAELGYGSVAPVGAGLVFSGLFVLVAQNRVPRHQASLA